MRAILKSRSTVDATAAALLQQQWIEEHEGYYAKPCSSPQREGRDQTIGGVVISVGYIPHDTAFAAMQAAGVSLPHRVDFAFGWLTSGGNLTLCAVGDDGTPDGPCTVWEYRDGRRHGLRQVLGADASYRYISTMRPDTHPNCIGLMPNPDDVPPPHAVSPTSGMRCGDAPYG